MRTLINIDVGDLALAELFYCEAFDLKVGRRFGAQALELLGASVAIYLLRKDEATAAASSTLARRSYQRHWTPVHLDFVVDEIDLAVRKAVSAGAVLEDPVQTQRWGRIAHLGDPFGHGFCLIQFLGRGYDEIAGQ